MPSRTDIVSPACQVRKVPIREVGGPIDLCPSKTKPNWFPRSLARQRKSLFAVSHPLSFCIVPNKPIELPPKMAQAFVRDMRAFFKAKNQLKQDEIASRQLHALWAFQRPREKKLRLADVKEMFLQMRDHA